MTQKEYQENINRLERENEELRRKLEIAERKSGDLTTVLEDYYRKDQALQMVQNMNRDLETRLLAKEEILQGYAVVMKRINIDV